MFLLQAHPKSEKGRLGSTWGGAVEFTFVGITMFINPMGRSTSLVAIVILKHPLSSLELHVQDIPYTIHI